MALSLKVHHLARYKSIATLLVKQWRADGLRGFDPTDPTSDDGAMADDARQLADDLESMGPTFVKLGQLLSTVPSVSGYPITPRSNRDQAQNTFCGQVCAESTDLCPRNDAAARV